MTPLEKDIEKALVAMIKRRGGLCLKWVCPGWSGVPDRIVLLPGGRVFFIELKQPKGGRLSELQKFWRDQLQRLGCRYWLIWSHEDVKALERILQAEDDVRRL